MCNLSAFWWRQLGRDDLAQEVEAGRQTKKQRERAAAAATRSQERAARRQARLDARPPEYEVAEIIQEVKTDGAAKVWFQVRWAGYDPSWELWRIQGEPGTPLITWEPWKYIARTEAYAAWKAREEM